MRALLTIAFILSGAAGLIYESVWSRYIGLFVGHSAYAQVIVLAVFLGGMALGSAVVARYSERIRQPLIWYAGVELGIAAGGLVFHFVFGGVTNFAYDTVFPAVGGMALVFAKWGIAALLILPQSTLLGATFPLISTGFMRIERARSGNATPAGRTLSLLYFANSIGAAAGVILAGFVLVGAFGLPGTLMSAAFTNLLAAAIVFVVAGWISDDERTPLGMTDAPPAPAIAEYHPASVRQALIIVAIGTAIASFIYEIAWVRLLSFVVGSATHSFELMLSAFILGIALGALWIRSRADTLRDPLNTLATVQWLMGALALATVPLYLLSFGWTAWWLDTLQRNETGYAIFSVVKYGFCLTVMLPATFCAGMTLPLITRTSMAAGGGERAIGTIYSVNTLGSILGAGLASLVLIPLFQLKATLLIGASIDMLLGTYLIARFYRNRASGRRRLLILGGGAAALVINVALKQHFDRGILTSGVYRYAAVPEPGQRKLAFYRDGRTATVSVRGDGDDGYSLATNGKPDASLTRDWLHPVPPSAPRKPIGGDQVTQAFLPLITLAHAPNAKNAAVIGFGSGVSSHILLGSPVLEQLVTVEIEPAMAEASKLFRPANQRVYDDKRSKIVIDDAKSYFASAGRRFDLIMSEPSNPWVSGVSGLFTDEFYRRIKQYLTPDGVFGQWLHLYEIDDDLVANVIAAVHRNFPAYEIFYTSSVDILIVATPAPHLRVPDWKVVAYPKIAEDLTRFRQLSPELFEALRVANRDVLAPLLDESIPVNSDYYPYLDLDAERTRYDHSQATAIIGLGNDRFPLGLVLAGRRTPFGTDVAPAVQIMRIEELALGASLRTGVIPLDTGNDQEALRQARHRLATLRAQMLAGRPSDWQLWMHDVLMVDLDLHGGATGVVDDKFYSDLLAYTRQQQAPSRIPIALEFLRALSGWNWPAADSAGDRVLESGSEAVGLVIGADLLRDGLVVAKLKQGDLVGARRVYNILANHGSRTPGDFRTRLLGAWITRAEYAAKGLKSFP